MTDISTTLIATARTAMPRPKLPTRSIGTTILAIPSAVWQAFYMAYAAPYQAMRRGPNPAGDAELQGRDPSW